MTQHTYYAIEHIPTGKYMPERKKGYSYWDPLNPEWSDSPLPPRLVKTRKKAERIIIEYCKGKRVFREHPSDYSLKTIFEVCDPKMSTIEPRDKKEYRVRAVILTFTAPNFNR